MFIAFSKRDVTSCAKYYRRMTTGTAIIIIDADANLAEKQ